MDPLQWCLFSTLLPRYPGCLWSRNEVWLTLLGVVLSSPLFLFLCVCWEHIQESLTHTVKFSNLPSEFLLNRQLPITYTKLTTKTSKTSALWWVNKTILPIKNSMLCFALLSLVDALISTNIYRLCVLAWGSITNCWRVGDPHLKSELWEVWTLVTPNLSKVLLIR